MRGAMQLCAMEEEMSSGGVVQAPLEAAESASRHRLKHADSDRPEFPDSGPDMARLRMRWISIELLNAQDSARAMLERELDIVEKRHPMAVALGLLETMMDKTVEEPARMASVLLKNFVSRCHGWHEIAGPTRLDAIRLLFEDLATDKLTVCDNTGRVLAAICDVESIDAKQKIIEGLCREAELGHIASCNALRHLGRSTLKLFDEAIVKSLCVGLFAISSAEVADARIVRSICDVVMNLRADEQDHSNLFSNDMLCAAITFAARTCQVVELRARALDLFELLWRSSREGVQLSLLARAGREAIELNQEDSIVERGAEFWAAISADERSRPFLDSVMDGAIILISQRWLSHDVEEAVRHLLVTLVCVRGECADTLGACLLSIPHYSDDVRERYVMLTCIGALCHSAWVSPSDASDFSRRLITAALDGDESTLHSVSMWALEASCAKACALLYSSPGDFGRLMHTLTTLLASTNKDCATTACRCLSYIINHDMLLASGRLCKPHLYNGELGHVPSTCSKSNRFSAYFSSLIESLTLCVATAHSSNVTALLIDASANDILGFVSWLLSRQIRALWSRVSTTTGLVSGRKRPWMEPPSPLSGSQVSFDLSPSTSNEEAMRSVTPPSAARNKPSVTVESACVRIGACIERLARGGASQDPALWKSCGEAANVLGRVFVTEPEHRVVIMQCLKKIARYRGDLEVKAIVYEQLKEEENDNVIAALGLSFVLARNDVSIFTLIESSCQQSRSFRVRCAAIRAMADYIVERNRQHGDASALVSRLGTIAVEVLQCVDSTVQVARSKNLMNTSEDDSIDLELKDQLDNVWEALDASTEAFLSLVSAPIPTGTLPHSHHEQYLARRVSDLIAKKASLACKCLPFHQKKTGVALRSLAMIVHSASRFSRTIVEQLFETRYDEFGPVFDVVAQAVGGDACGETAQKAGKVASDALLLVFPKGTFH